MYLLVAEDLAKESKSLFPNNLQEFSKRELLSLDEKICDFLWFYLVTFFSGFIKPWY